MQFIITDARLATSRVVHLSGAKLVLAFCGLACALMLVAAALYHWVFLKGAREGWPVVGSVLQLMVRDEFEQRDRFMRENLDAMARKVGEMQARLQQLESLGERVSGLAGLPPKETKAPPGRGGMLVTPRSLTLEELQSTLDALETSARERADLLTVAESRLFDQRLRRMMIPTQQPIPGALGSAFGWRIDPFTGRQALHTGLDFPADTGTPILAAAGGVVVAAEYHFAYGNMVEVDHGNNLVTRYAHASRLLVKKGDLVKRGQKLAEVGSTGRSTGPHLHFEVMVDGSFQDPSRFLAGRNPPVPAAAAAAAAAPAATPAQAVAAAAPQPAATGR